MLSRLFPHPYMTLSLIAIWLLLVNNVLLGNILLGVLFGIVIPRLTHPYWPDRPHIRHLPALGAYVVMVAWDIILANITVARIVLFMPNARIRSAWITVPLDLRSPEAITMLGATITLTPGTITADMSSCGRALLIHSLHAPDPDAIRDEIKTRYEARLKRIFE
ncbi:MAG: Na+/H+ antiporter subunit E [Cereibacter sphaeroides]|uniref:Na+/H+ antiporter subunit E n=1 Tax=Cereibacter sphaeroides TaxID=1063 RepID=A0A2W5UFC6_CERSP|nr:MAG: Na+/H+ antiporter subunit E [Cereibacter sphaeroides]